MFLRSRSLLLAACFVLLLASTLAAERNHKPNVIVIFTDDHGYADLSSQGVVDDIKTPHVDALAAGGVRMTSGYVTAPQCVPSRAGLLSGRYQNRFGVESNGQPLAGFNRQRTIAERLKQAGYATGMIGKWHLGPQGEIVDHGFDDVFYRGGSWTNFDVEGNDVPPGTEFDELYHIDAGSAAARAFIARHHDEPFFLYLAYRAPHVPLDATEKYLRRFPGKMPHRRRQALAMLSAVDDGVGGVMESLRKYGLEEDTLIFFIGDNGAPLKIHKTDAPGGGPGWDGSLNDPLNGEKGMLTEGGIRVPFVVYWKGHFTGGRVYDHPVISLDVAATALAAAGLPHDPQLDGVDLVPFLSGENKAAPHETLYWRWIAQSAVREGNWKYLRGGAREYLFDLEADKEEQHNLLAKHPDVAARLRERLTAWADNLEPPGLETKSMSANWERYFDHFLDGKPAPPPAAEQHGRVQGWIARNGSAALKDGALHVRPNAGDGRRRPFLARSGLDLPKAPQAVLDVRVPKGGSVAFAWRERGQKEFPAGQVVRFRCEASDAWQRREVELPSAGKVIHVRLLLPPQGAAIRQIEFRGADDGRLASWNFAPREADRQP